MILILIHILNPKRPISLPGCSDWKQFWRVRQDTTPQRLAELNAVNLERPGILRGAARQVRAGLWLLMAGSIQRKFSQHTKSIFREYSLRGIHTLKTKNWELLTSRRQFKHQKMRELHEQQKALEINIPQRNEQPPAADRGAGGSGAVSPAQGTGPEVAGLQAPCRCSSAVPRTRARRHLTSLGGITSTGRQGHR